jgi:endonuclease/exonuclease/phosphatase family metal-dependent hydrolase
VRSVIAASLLAAAGLVPAAVQSRDATSTPAVFRVATFNASLNRRTNGGLARDLASSDSAQARAVAEIIQRVRPDILLLQEFDYDAAGKSLADFQSNYLARGQNGASPISYGYSFFTTSNTGQPSGLDLDNDGRVGDGEDALGFGEFPGQYAMALLSKYPIDMRGARTFGRFLWRDMPRALLPPDWYSPAELAVLPLSSKNHWDIPVRVGRLTVHVLASHPTPPAFDGAEDRNGRRNHDEIRFWVDYLTPKSAGYVRDDAGGRGGFRGRHFVLMGDQNSDPVDGDSLRSPILALLAHQRVNSTFTPSSAGGAQASTRQGGANFAHKGDPRFDTADFSDRLVGNLRVDYVLPSRGLAVCDGGVYWPSSEEPEAALVWGDRPSPSSDHRLVWLDLTADAGRCPPGSDPTAIVTSSPHP